jgi:hypothetical protein
MPWLSSGTRRRDYSAADAFRTTVTLHGNARLREVRVVRDYGMYDRRESQYYPRSPDPALPSTSSAVKLTASL